MQKLWEIADNFRSKVCCQLNALREEDRRLLQGEYLFIIDQQPRFLVLVDVQGAWSVCFNQADVQLKGLNYQLDVGCPFSLSLEQIEHYMTYARTTVTTDSMTLKKILLGQLKAKIAFLTSKVTLDGDLSSFLKMVSFLKRSGVKPLNPSIENSFPFMKE